MSPKITVLMPVYNGLSYLAEAIEGVLRQSFEDFEFLIIDDASTDGSVARIQSYKDPRIRLVSNERNLGQVRSLNKGLELARGKYVARLDQDDVCLPERLRKQFLFLEERPDVAVVGSWGYRVDFAGRTIDRWRGSVAGYGDFLARLLLLKNPLWHPTVMFRREIVLEAGGYDESSAPAEDYDLWVRLALQGYTGAIVAETLVTYRVHEAQQSIRKKALQWERAQQSQKRLLGRFVSEDKVELLAALLRLECAFVQNCDSKEQVIAVLRSLADLLVQMRSGLELSQAEFEELSRTIYRWVGTGAKWGVEMSHCPSLLFYPAFFALSPLLIPKVRPFLRYVRDGWGHLPYLARAIVAPRTGQ